MFTEEVRIAKFFRFWSECCCTPARWGNEVGERNFVLDIISHLDLTMTKYYCRPLQGHQTDVATKPIKNKQKCAVHIGWQLNGCLCKPVEPFFICGSGAKGKLEHGKYLVWKMKGKVAKLLFMWRFRPAQCRIVHNRYMNAVTCFNLCVHRRQILKTIMTKIASSGIVPILFSLVLTVLDSQGCKIYTFCTLSLVFVYKNGIFSPFFLSLFV